MKHLAMAVVVKQDKVLVQKRYHADRGMVVNFPGGKVNLAETGTDAAIRELEQGTGITGVSHAATYTKMNQIGGRTYFVIFKASQDVEPSVVKSESEQEFAWISPEQIPQNDFYATDREFINQYLTQYTLMSA